MNCFFKITFSNCSSLCQGMNTGIQDSYNLGWKLALVAKGFAPASLLETFNSERYPVVAEMLDITTKLMKKTTEESNNEKGWDRTGDVNQLGVNYRGSQIVICEGEAVMEESIYESGSSYKTRAEGYVKSGDRAPDATGLQRMINGNPEGVATRLFKIFDPTRHTVLIFAEQTDYVSVLSSLRTYDVTLVRPVLITKSGKGRDISADYVFEDSDGHANSAYKGPTGFSGVFVIRPDGMVGARVRGVKTLGRYFEGIFEQTATPANYVW